MYYITWHILSFFLCSYKTHGQWIIYFNFFVGCFSLSNKYKTKKFFGATVFSTVVPFSHSLKANLFVPHSSLLCRQKVTEYTFYDRLLHIRFLKCNLSIEFYIWISTFNLTWMEFAVLEKEKSRYTSFYFA